MKQLRKPTRGRLVRLRVNIKRALRSTRSEREIQKQRELEVCRSEFASTLSANL